MLACENYPALQDRQLSKIGTEFPPWLGKLYESHKLYGRCFILVQWGGGVICFRNLDDPSKYASSEFAFILVDELTKNSKIVFTFLRTRLRWPGLPDVECQFVGATNPGSVGHGWVKALWMDKIFGEEWISLSITGPRLPMCRSTAKDNKFLGADYWAVLGHLAREPARKPFGMATGMCS
jgi:phage terminase large subunit